MDSSRKVNISLLTDDSLSQSFWEQVAITERFWIFGREARDQSIKTNGTSIGTVEMVQLLTFAAKAGFSSSTLQIQEYSVTLQEKIGGGGYSTVHLSCDSSSRHFVAKILQAPDCDRRDKTNRKISLQRDLSDFPNVFRLFALSLRSNLGGRLDTLNGQVRWSQPWPVDDFFKQMVDRCPKADPTARPTASALAAEFRTRFSAPSEAL
jgi:hypothetical protein